MAEVIDVLTQVVKPADQLVRAETGLVFAQPMSPWQTHSDDDPPGWDKREEGWSIDELLGLYEPDEQRITIFDKGIAHAAPQLDVSAGHLEYIVKIHEWAHAVFHLGVDQAESVELAEAFLEHNAAPRAKAEARLTVVYKDVEPYVHEQIAQTITRLALDELASRATLDEAKARSGAISDTFRKLTSRQPRQYRLDHLDHVATEQLRHRLRSLISLIRDQRVRGDETAWNTIMPW